MRLFITCIFLSLFFECFSQEVPVPLSNKALYDFIDEAANNKLIDINSCVKPYSRMFVASQLAVLDTQRTKLSKRQNLELDFYLKDFYKETKEKKTYKKRIDLFYYKDSLFSLTINPVLGSQFWFSDSGMYYSRYVGAEAWAYIGKHWSFYASLRDFHESKPLAKETYLTQRQGGNYKGENDYSEMRGGIAYAWNWGSIALLKDYQEWGNNVNGANILSAHQPSYALIKLKLKPVKWFDFNYIHGWLVSDVMDSSKFYSYKNSYGTNNRLAMASKYIAANFFTFRPFRNFYFSLGNSIIYSDMPVQPAYLIPILFYKSVDHTYNSTGKDEIGQNSQMFFDISSRQINHLHIYASFFVDEVGLSRMFDKDKQSNFFSIKCGLSQNGLIFKNGYAGIEYTRTNPLVYRHIIPSSTFESNSFNMGHYLVDNADEVYVYLGFKPMKNLNLQVSYCDSRKGPDYTALATSRWGSPFMSSVKWHSTNIAFKASFQIINDGFFFMEYTNSNIRGDFNIDPIVYSYTPSFMRGLQNTIAVGANFGF